MLIGRIIIKYIFIYFNQTKVSYRSAWDQSILCLIDSLKNLQDLGTIISIEI